jgi:gliding motility-associated-like protein
LFAYSPLTVFIDSAFTFTDGSSGAVAWSWNFGDGDTSSLQNVTHSYSTAGTFIVCLIVTSGNGCTDTTCFAVDVLPHDIEVPNVFTPNGDNINDLLVFENLEFFPGTRLAVYDRWGVLVFENDNYQNDWNGKKMNNGGECVDGTYYFILNGSGLKAPVTGFVTLIRGK